MSEPFLSQISIIGFNFAPRGWAFCDGQLLPIAQNQSLYSLLGTTFGGDGRTTFALPDMRGRTPMHKGIEYSIGTKAGSETVTLTAAEISLHNHLVKASDQPANKTQPANNTVLGKAQTPVYCNADNIVGLKASTVSRSGGSMPHNNMQPSLALNFIIALQGLFPSRN